jgi:hypothetical protein
MLLPNTPLQRAGVAPRRSPLNGRPFGVRIPDPNNPDHWKFRQEPQTFVRL